MPNVYQDLQNASQNQPSDNAPKNEPKVDGTTSNQQPNTPADKQTHAPADDIISRASQIGLDDGEQNGDSNQTDDDILRSAGFDRNQWNSMLEKLPADQRQQLEAAYKSLQKGADSKFQKAADMLRQAENMQQQPWTLDRVAKLTKDPAFVQAAQQYTQMTQGNQAPNDSGLTDDEWSNLSESEKAKFQELTQNQMALQLKLDSILISQQDAQLKQRYKNYDATQVNGLREQLMRGEVQATNEHLWKVVDYDSAIQRAYKLGLQDRQSELGEKINASSVGAGAQITPSGDAPVKGQGENTVSFFKRLAEYNRNRIQQSQR